MPALRAPATSATTTTATTKRTRRRVGPEQLKALENAYDDNPYPDETTRDALAARVQMEPKAVSVWFQNKRQAERKQSLHAATTAANAGLGPPPVAIAHPGRRRQRVSPTPKTGANAALKNGNGATATLKNGANAALTTGANAITLKKGASAEKVQDEEEEIDELADDSDGDWDATPPGTVASASRSASANSSRAGSVRPVPRLSGSGSGSGPGSKSGSASGSGSKVGSGSAKALGSAPASAKATLARSASVSTIPAAAKAPLPRTASLSDMTAQHKALELARASALAEMPKEQLQPPQSGPTGVVYHVYPMPPGGYYPAYGMGMYGYGYGMGMGMGMGYYDPSAWGAAQTLPPVPPTPVLAAAEREKEREPISRTPSLASSSSTLIARTPSTSTMMSRTPSLASTLGGSSPTVEAEEEHTPPKKRPRQLYDLMASSSPPPEPEPEPRRRRTLEWACAKERGGGEVDAQDALRKAQQLKERREREREARRAQEEDDTAMAALMLVGLRGG